MWEHVALHQTWFGGSGALRCGASGLGKTKTKTTNFQCDFGRFGGWAVEGIQMLPVVPASWWHMWHMWHMWHIETRIETQPANQLSKHLEALDATKSYSSLYRF